MKKVAIGCGIVLVLFVGMLVALGIPMFRATKDAIQG